MNIDQKLTAIRDVIQQDVGNRGLARDPNDNLLTKTLVDFAGACQGIAATPIPTIAIVTGFFIPTAKPPAFETDGPLGTVFLVRCGALLGWRCQVLIEPECTKAIAAGFELGKLSANPVEATLIGSAHDLESIWVDGDEFYPPYSHFVSLERVGPGATGRCYTMKGLDVTEKMAPAHTLFAAECRVSATTIGIGDGGNEIGMGKIPHETIVKNIPNGDLIHCRVATDYLIVAGVSNWGAYALAAGVALLRGVELPAELFDPDREREILQVMVEKGPLVDGVTGQQTATVDGLSWDDYIKPLVEIGRIVRS